MRMSQLAIITGAGTGIGAKFHRRGTYCSAYWAKKRDPRTNNAQGTGNTRSEAFAIDCSNTSDIAKYYDYIDQKAPPVNSLICCAGARSPAGNNDLLSIAKEWEISFATIL